MLPLHHLSHMPCHDHLASDMHCFGCCPFSPYDVSDIAHEEAPIVSSYMLGEFDPSHSLHDPNTCVHHMLPMNKHAIVVPHTCTLNLCPHRAIHNNYSFMMDGMFLYHASNFLERCLPCANSHVHIHIMMDDVYIYHTHNFYGLCFFRVGTHEYLSTSQSHELTKRALKRNDDLGFHGVSFPTLSLRQDFAHFFYMALTWLWVIYHFSLYAHIAMFTLHVICSFLYLCHAFVTHALHYM